MYDETHIPLSRLRLRLPHNSNSRVVSSSARRLSRSGRRESPIHSHQCPIVLVSLYHFTRVNAGTLRKCDPDCMSLLMSAFQTCSLPPVQYVLSARFLVSMLAFFPFSSSSLSVERFLVALRSPLRTGLGPTSDELRDDIRVPQKKV